MFTNIINKQYRRPTGFLGWYIGNRMARAHQPENDWTIAALGVQTTDHVLEIGFGPGIAIEELTKRVPDGYIAGIDFSKAMVAAAGRRNAQAIKQGQVALHYGDAASLPFDDSLFDKAYSIHSIYFWEHPQKVLAEVWRVLKPGGMLVLTILPQDKWGISDPDAPVGTAECKPYTGDELRHLLVDVGFRATEIQTDSNENCLSNYSVIGIK